MGFSVDRFFVSMYLCMNIAVDDCYNKNIFFGKKKVDLKITHCFLVSYVRYTGRNNIFHNLCWIYIKWSYPVLFHKKQVS